MGLRQPGKLLDTGETLQERLDKLAAPVAAAASPLGALRVGATPDQAKMVKTQARMQAATAQALQPQPTPPPQQQLATVERQAQGQGGIVAQQLQPQLDTSKALAGLSSVGQQRVQAAINEKLNQLSQGGSIGTQLVDDTQLMQLLGLSGTQLTEKAADINQLKALLQSYAAEPTQEKLIQLEQLRRTAGFKGDFTSDVGVQQFFKSASSTVAGASATALQDQLTVSDFTPDQFGFNSLAEMAQVLGVSESALSTMTIQDLQAQVQRAARQQRQQVDELQAKIAALPPGSAQRRIYERRLNNLLAGGAAQLNIKSVETAEDIDLADKVTVGGNRYTVAQLLDDEQFSRLVERYLNAPDEDTRNRLLPGQEFSQLRDWLEANRLGLEDIIREASTVQEDWKKVISDYRNLGSVQVLGGHKDLNIKLDDDVIDAVLGDQALDAPDGLVTQTQLNQVKQVIQQSPIGSLIQDPANAELLTKIKPTDIAKFKDANNNWLPVDTIKSMFEAAKVLKADPIAAKFLGVQPDSDFVTKTQLDTYTANIQLYNTVKNQYPGWLANDAFLNAPLATKQLFVQHPQRFKQFEEVTALKQKIPQDATPQQVFQALTNISPDQVTATYNRLVHQAALGNRAAREKLAQFKSLFGGDGNPATGLPTIIQKLVTGINNVNVNTAAQGQAATVLSSLNQLVSSRPHEMPQARSVYGSSSLKWADPALSADRFFDIVGQVIRPGERITQQSVLRLFNALNATGAYAHHEREGGRNQLIDAIMGDIVDELQLGDIAEDAQFLKDWDQARDWMKNYTANKEIQQLDQQLSNTLNVPSLDGRINHLSNQLGQLEALMAQRPDLAQNSKVQDLYNHYRHKLQFDRYQKDVIDHEVPRLQEQWGAVKADDGINGLTKFLKHHKEAQQVYRQTKDKLDRDLRSGWITQKEYDKALTRAQWDLRVSADALIGEFTWWNERHKAGIATIKELYDKYQQWGDGLPEANRDGRFNELRNKVNKMVDLLREAATTLGRQSAV